MLDDIPSDAPAGPTSLDRPYAERLLRKQTAWWKRAFGVQAPYRWNLRRLRPGLTLDIGCGIGRNLLHLPGQSVGVDPNAHAVAIARERGLPAMCPAEFWLSPEASPGRFDTLLLAHVCEHLGAAASVELLNEYLPLLRPGGRVILMTPQESGYRSDTTHVEFLDYSALGGLLTAAGLRRDRAYSFPLPRACGRLFRFNEFVVIGRKAA